MKHRIIDGIVIPTIDPERIINTQITIECQTECCYSFYPKCLAGSLQFVPCDDCLYSLINFSTFEKVANQYWRKD